MAFPAGMAGVQLRTRFLRAPYCDWAALSLGHKQEFRAPVGGKVAQYIFTPTPVVLYAESPQLKTRHAKLMVLVEHGTQTLMELAWQPEALAREGFASYEEFRRYWRARTRRSYTPGQRVDIYRLAPWKGADRARLGIGLLERLYAQYL